MPLASEQEPYVESYMDIHDHADYDDGWVNMVFDTAGPTFDPDSHDAAEEVPNADAAKFIKLLENVMTPLYPGCEDHSPFEVVTRLLSIKFDFNML